MLLTGHSYSVCRLMFYSWSEPIIQFQLLHRLLFHMAFAVRCTSGEWWIAEQPWAHILPYCHWFLTQQRMFWYLAHWPYRPRCPQPNISSWLIHVQAKVSYGYRKEGLTTVLFCSVLWSVEWIQKAKHSPFPQLPIKFYQNWASSVF